MLGTKSANARESLGISCTIVIVVFNECLMNVTDVLTKAVFKELYDVVSNIWSSLLS